VVESELRNVVHPEPRRVAGIGRRLDSMVGGLKG
jgi:hypothetical protein